MVEPQEPEKLGASVSHTEATRPEIPINDEQASATHVKGDPLEIEFLLMSGKRKRWTVGTQETVEQVRTRIFQDWPRDWRASEAPVSSPDSLRLLYLGKFLEPSGLLSSYNLKPAMGGGEPGSPSIVHLHIRTLLPDSDPDDTLVKPKHTQSTCRCCTIA